MKYLVIYYDEEGRSRQIVRPKKGFIGDWKGLVESIAGDRYYKFEIK